MFAMRTDVQIRVMARKDPRASVALVSVVCLVAVVLSACGSAAQKRTYRIGILSGLGAFFAPAVDGFKAQMTELGYVEGQNITYDVRETIVDLEAYRSISQGFVTDRVDLIFSFPTEASMEAKAAAQGTGIPVVFDLAFTDVDGVNLIESVRQPGGDITGVRFPSKEIASKRLQILMEMAPQARRIWVPYLRDYPNVPGQLETIRQQASEGGIQLIEFAASSPPELQAELERRAALEDVGLDAILMIAEPLAVTPVFYEIMGKFSYERGVPIGGALMSLDGAYGSIFGLGPDPEATGRQAAILADKILSGTSAGTIPVVTVESYFQIDYGAARALGITVPEGLLKQADLIIR